MIRNINYTGRRHISSRNVDIRISKSDNKIPDFNVTFNFDDLDIPKDSVIFLEAYDRYSLMRFECGTVGNPSSLNNVKLDRIQNRDAINFRIKIVDIKDKHGLLLAESDKIISRDKWPPESLLLVRFRDIGSQIWQLDYDTIHGPILVLNSILMNVGFKELVQHNNLFHCLVLPGILREILTRILVIEQNFDEDGSDWQSKWLKYIDQKIGILNPPEFNRQENNIDEIDTWINEVAIPSFCQYFELLGKFEQKMGDMLK